MAAPKKTRYITPKGVANYCYLDKPDTKFKDSGEFKGFGHVQFCEGESTDAAVQKAGTEVNGRAIRVDYAPPRNRDSMGGGGGGSPRGSFGGGGRGGGGRGGRGGGGRGGGRGDGGRGGRGRGGASPFSSMKAKNTGAIVAGAGKKMTFDD